MVPLLDAACVPKPVTGAACRASAPFLWPLGVPLAQKAGAPLSRSWGPHPNAEDVHPRGPRQLTSRCIPGVLRGNVEPSTQLREELLSFHPPGRVLSTYCALQGQKASLARTLRHTARVATIWAVPPNLWGCGHEHTLRARPGCTCFASSTHRSGNVLNVPAIRRPPRSSARKGGVAERGQPCVHASRGVTLHALSPRACPGVVSSLCGQQELPTGHEVGDMNHCTRPMCPAIMAQGPPEQHFGSHVHPQRPVSPVTLSRVEPLDRQAGDKCTTLIGTFTPAMSKLAASTEVSPPGLPMSLPSRTGSIWNASPPWAPRGSRPSPSNPPLPAPHPDPAPSLSHVPFKYLHVPRSRLVRARARPPERARVCL